jgi:serine/threonine protein kinase
MPDIPQDLQAALGQRYALSRVLGRGGMATVYLADDRKHRRQVALKVLRPDLAASIGAERFLREIEIAARLTHPHILALHDSGEASGFLYYVMPFIEGPSLRGRLEAERRLEADGALAVAAPVADALAYAHRMGVFHRDIKPENILFSQGHPIVADFGIAKAIVTAGGANLTRTGFPLGTPGYMSPEQAAGLTDLDERSDTYSLAVVIYEMMVGEIPGRWPTEDAVRQGRFLEAPPAHRARLAQVGSRIEGALVRGMAIRSDQRTPTPEALIGELTGAAAPRRKYSEEEVRQIIGRAAEIEATSPTQGGAMTVGGVEALAAEVGIAPETVRQAAQALAVPARGAAPAPTPPDANRRNVVIGGPTRLLIERVVEGEVPEGEFPVMVEEIRRWLNRPGQVSQIGRTFSWTSAGGAGSTRNTEVSVSVRGGRTHISMREGLGNLIGGIFGGIGGGMGGGGIGPVLGIFTGLGAGTAVIAAVPFWLALTYAVARTSYFYAVRRRQRELDGLADRLAALAQELVPRPALDAPRRQLAR